MNHLKNTLCRYVFGLTGVFIAYVSSQTQAAENRVGDLPTKDFLRTYCIDCHEGDTAEAGLDFSKLGTDLSQPAAMKRWVQIHDRVQSGEMPPENGEKPGSKTRNEFTAAIGKWLSDFEQQQHAKLGRVRSRRLTRIEVERSLLDVLGIDIPLQNLLPEDSRSAGFTKVADGQVISHFQLKQHVDAVDAALDEAFRRALGAPDNYDRDFSARDVARANPRRRCREPEMLNGSAVVWSGGVIFYGRLPATTARENGWYRFTVKAKGLNLPKTGGVWATVNTGQCTSSAPLLNYITAFEATKEAKTVEFTAWLPKGHMLEIRPGDVTLKKARFAGGQIGTGEGEPQNVPGIAIDRVTMQRVHLGASDDETRQLLFGDLKVVSKDRRSSRVESERPADDIERLLLAMARRAFRRPTTKSEIAGYIQLAHDELQKNESLRDALRVGYRALLCSPRFLYLTEQPGPLDDWAIAARLSFFLTGSTPDEKLSQLADAEKLNDKDILQAETLRLLRENSNRRRFIVDFAAEWLELDQIDFTQPDRKLFSEFDAIVKHAMVDETHSFLQTLLDENLSTSAMLSGNFTFLNSRLARYYDIDNVTGDEFRRIALPADHPRGGLLSQGAVLKVTANGTNTSPVVRGVWVAERILGTPIPPPPDNVPAIEPDIRGATTIREQLAKHRSQQSCAACHVKIDPPGFALENFDPAGQWRDRYRQLVGGRRKTGAKVDASYQMPDGEEFSGYNEFRSLVADEPRVLAKNLAEKFITYGTGAPVSFADRDAIEKIVESSAKEHYGFRSILLNVVTSELFLSK